MSPEGLPFVLAGYWQVRGVAGGYSLARDVRQFAEIRPESAKSYQPVAI